MTNTKVKNCIAAENIKWAEDFAKRKLKFAGHIIRDQNEHKLARLVMEGLVEGKKDRGRQRRVWGDDLKEWSKSTSIGPESLFVHIPKEMVCRVRLVDGIYSNLSVLCTFGQIYNLYHERYENIAVMFASIPNYKEFYDETDVNKQGLECLRLLNEIICDFDKNSKSKINTFLRFQLLSKPKFSCIEKIKTIGSTYMAASGLQPGKDSSKDRPRTEHNVIILLEFGIALMSVLDQINKESFQRFRLRVGINHGPVIAGVVGAQKPQYDIWGNTVNVASRMDSCGNVGKVQVTESTAIILKNAGYECTSRGLTFVKGKGNLNTYFVKTPYDNCEY
ncbi:Adenylate cyclase type 2 [Nymphon striatum]|nr:Adenylate cyclase type 2 [Nymphon striatum]